MRKVSAHYCLLPDGSVGKWPVIVLDDNGSIVEVRVNAAQFREEPGLEYFGGVIVPGFIEDMRTVSFSGITEETLMRTLNRFQSQGSIRFLFGREQNTFLSVSKSKSFFDTEYEKKDGSMFAGISTWDRVKEKTAGGDDVINAIFAEQSVILDKLPEQLKWGRIETGFNPGLVLIKGLDLDGMRLTANTKIKILNY